MLRLVTLNQPSSEGISAYTCPECQSKACEAMDTGRQVNSRIFNIMVCVSQLHLPYAYTASLLSALIFVNLSIVAELLLNYV